MLLEGAKYALRVGFHRAQLYMYQSTSRSKPDDFHESQCEVVFTVERQRVCASIEKIDVYTVAVEFLNP